jgi:hypothetical protein
VFLKKWAKSRTNLGEGLMRLNALCQEVPAALSMFARSDSCNYRSGVARAAHGGIPTTTAHHVKDPHPYVPSRDESLPYHPEQQEIVLRTGDPRRRRISRSSTRGITHIISYDIILGSCDVILGDAPTVASLSKQVVRRRSAWF